MERNLHLCRRPSPSWFVVLLFLIVAACQAQQTKYFGTTVPKHPPNEIWINNGTEPEWLDPGKISGVPDGQIVINLFAGLVQKHPKTLKVMPDLAKRWTISKDGKTYHFYLRKSHWTDGKLVTAHDFEWSWKRVLDPKTGSKYASFLYPLRNGAAFNQRGVLVEIQGKAINRKKLQNILSKHVKIDRLEPSEEPRGFWAYVGGEKKAQKRKKLIKKFHGKKISDVLLKLRPADPELVGVKALNDKVLEVHLEGSIPYFLSLVAFYTALPVPRHVIERLEKQGINPDLWTRFPHIVSNGPYKLKEWRFRHYYLVERNPTYWDAKNVKTDRIRVFMVESYNTGLNFYRGGEVDWTGAASMLPGEFMEYLAQYKDLHVDPYLGIYYYMFNTKAPPLDDWRVRKALSLSIDRESIVNHVTQGGQIPWAGMVPDGLQGFQAPKRELYNPQKAQALLREAGFPNGKGFRKLKLLYNTTEQHRQIAEAIQQMWKSVLNIDIELENQEWKVYFKSRNALAFDVCRAGWIGDYADPFTFLELFSEFNGNNNTGWADKEYDRLLKKANQTVDLNQRMRILEQADRVLLRKPPIAPIFVYTKSYMKKPYLKGFWPNYRDEHFWKYFWIDRRWYEEVPKEPVADLPPPYKDGRG